MGTLWPQHIMSERKYWNIFSNRGDKMEKIQNKTSLFIQGSLFLLSIKALFDLCYIFSIGDLNPIAIGVNLFVLAVSIGQLVGVRGKIRYTWLLALLQIVPIYITRDGTFSWFFNYAVGMFSMRSYHHYYTYTLLAYFIITETFKIVWLYKNEQVAQ